MSYILFTADFDENTSDVKTYTTLDEFVSDWTDDFETYQEVLNHCEENGDDSEHQAIATIELVTTGSYNAEWWDYHLIEVKE